MRQARRNHDRFAIDISLVLLVILFVTAPLLSYPSLPIRLPKARGEDDAGRAVQVTLTAEGRLAVGSREVEWPAFGGLLCQELARPHDWTLAKTNISA